MALSDSLRATARDLVLAAVAAFVSSFALALEAGVTLPALKAAAVTAAYAALRAAAGYLATKLGK